MSRMKGFDTIGIQIGLRFELCTSYEIYVELVIPEKRWSDLRTVRMPAELYQKVTTYNKCSNIPKNSIFLKQIPELLVRECFMLLE